MNKQQWKRLNQLDDHYLESFIDRIQYPSPNNQFAIEDNLCLNSIAPKDPDLLTLLFLRKANIIQREPKEH